MLHKGDIFKTSFSELGRIQYFFKIEKLKIYNFRCIYGRFTNIDHIVATSYTWQLSTWNEPSPMRYAVSVKYTLDFENLAWKKNVKYVINNFILNTYWKDNISAVSG